MAGRALWWQATDDASMQELLQAPSSDMLPDALDWPSSPEGSNRSALHRVAFRIARQRVEASHSSKDRVLMEEVKAIDDLLKAANLLIERLREWHALVDVDAVRSASDAEELAKTVAAVDVGNKNMDDKDMQLLRGFAEALRSIHGSWRAIEARIQDLMDDVAPNLATVIGPMVGARLIAIAGGLHRIGTMSAGTIQTLGAETALFRHIKEGSKPPKHGILFQHPLVFQAPRWQRGAVARILANHAALAARADASTGNAIAAELQVSMEADLARLRENKPKPPQRPPRGGGKRGGGKRGPRRQGGPDRKRSKGGKA